MTSKAKRRTIGWLALMSAAAALPACQTAPPTPPPPAVRAEPPADFFVPASATEPAPDHRILLPEYLINFGDQLEIIYQVRHDVTPEPYKLQIEDKLKVIFPHQVDLSQEVTIASDGRINLLLLDKGIVAAGMTVDELADRLRKAYAEKIRNPELTVVVEAANKKIEEFKRMITTSPRGQSRLIPVKPDGRISLPLIGDIMAFGRTTVQLRTALNKAYREANVEGIDVSANLLVIRPLRVYVMGEVARPGMLQVGYRTTLVGAIAQAGGWDAERADAENVLLIRRRGMKVPTGAVVNLAYLTRTLADQARDPDVERVDFAAHRFDPFLKDEDVIVIPSNRLARNADWIKKVFTEGIYGVLPFSASFTVVDDVNVFGND